MEKTKIDWADSSWNPVTGCRHNCPYCYAGKIAHRFSGGGENWCENNDIHILDDKIYGTDGENGKANPYPYGFQPTLHRYRLGEYENKKERTIFVCSMADLFGEWVPDEWIEEVFRACKKAPQHKYLFLTKNPERYIELYHKGMLPASDNMYYGSSVTDKKGLQRFEKAFRCIPSTFRTFASIEPLLEDITEAEEWDDIVKSRYADWIIVGAETGNRKNKVVPDCRWIKSIEYSCWENNIPLFMKGSISSIPMAGELVQEYPWDTYSHSEGGKIVG